MGLGWLLIVLLVALIYWWDTSAAKDNARITAKQQCAQQDLQLLDDTVALKKTRLKRNHKGNIALLRHFTFEFSSDGEQRTQGELQLLGKKLIHIHLDVHRIH
ncbi:MAG: DUF3301 domain-containing protein [Gammaproteobacteria bacterium]|nr:DUF3301 domain-containing protein [Gammaproteobacteria bacterium]